MITDADLGDYFVSDTVVVETAGARAITQAPHRLTF